MSKHAIATVPVFAFLLLWLPAGIAAQEASAAAGEPSAVAGQAAPFPLVPVLETALGGEFRWRPGWPVDFPPDAFSPAAGRAPIHITLSNGEDSFSLRRDGNGRIREFPFFVNGAWLNVTVAWSPAGEIAALNIGGGAADWEIEFPPGVFFSGSPAPPVKAGSGGQTFFVFFADNGNSLSETWYDEGGNLLAFYRAGLRLDGGGPWRVSSVQSWTGQGISLEEYFFESGGGISGIRLLGGAFSALYRKGRPVYWEWQPSAAADSSAASPSANSQAEKITLQWDENGLLVSMRQEDGGGANLAEYRYEYRLDSSGKWVNRQDIAIMSVLDVFAPVPGRSWTRKITYTEE